MGERTYEEGFHLQGEARTAVLKGLQRRQTSTCEMHSLLIRRSVLERLGGFEPRIVSKEHLDFSWRLAKAGYRLWLEPQAVVTFLIPSANDPIRWSDLPYFLLRWSPAWQRQSHDLLKKRWGLCEEGYIARRRQLSGWRIIDHALKPAIRAIPVLGMRWGIVERLSQIIYPAAALIADMQARRWRRKLRRIAQNPAGSVDV